MAKKTEGAAFGRWLDGALKARGLRNVDVANSTGVDPVQVMRWRRGTAIPGRHYMAQLAAALDMDRLDLERLASGPDSNLPDGSQAIAAEQHFWYARYEYLIEKKIPWSMREAYLAACEALADVFSQTPRGPLITPNAPAINKSATEMGSPAPDAEENRLTDCFPPPTPRYRSNRLSLSVAH